MTDRVGQQIGNYRLLRLLGQGGFAEVYVAEHTYLGTQAAIKLLYAHMTQSDIAPFQQEARMLANLIHPHIVRVLDFGIDNGTPFLVMDYAPGGSVRTRHPRGSRVALPTIAAAATLSDAATTRIQSPLVRSVLACESWTVASPCAFA